MEKIFNLSSFSQFGWPGQESRESWRCVLSIFKGACENGFTAGLTIRE